MDLNTHPSLLGIPKPPPVDHLSSLGSDDEDDLGGDRTPLESGDISLSKLPEFIERKGGTGDFREFVLDLKPEGRVTAGKLLNDNVAKDRKFKRLKAEDPTSLCLICVDMGKPLHNCLFYHKGNGGNKKKHFMRSHVEKGHVKEGEMYVFKRITELKGAGIGVAEKAPPKNNSETGIPLMANQTSDDLAHAIAKWSCATGQPVDCSEHPLFRRVLAVAANLRSRSDFSVPKEKLRTQTVNLSEAYHAFLKKKAGALRSYRAFVQFERSNDAAEPLLISVAHVNDNNPADLAYDVFPISKVEAVKNDSSNTALSEKEVIELVNSALNAMDAPIDCSKLAGARSDDSMINAKVALCKPAISRFSTKTDWFDIDTKKKDGCIISLINAAVMNCVGVQTARGADIPHEPSNDAIQAISAVQNAMRWLAMNKNYTLVSKVGKEKQMELVDPVLASNFDWTSIYRMIERALFNTDLLRFVNDPSSGPLLKHVELLTEMHAILGPIEHLVETIKRSWTKPLGYATLAIIALLMERYGVDITSGLLYPDAIKMKSETQLKELKFASLDAKGLKGPKKSKMLGEFSREGRNFFQSFIKNLIFCLCTQRGNRYFYEIVGVMADPLTFKYGKLIFGEGNREWNYESVKKLARAYFPAFETLSSTTQLVEDWYEDFGNEPIREFHDHPHPYTLLGFLEMLRTYDPLRFWSNEKHRFRFPTLYCVNLVTLAYVSTSTMPDSFFVDSSEADNDESPVLFEASMLVRRSLQASVASERLKVFAEKPNAPGTVVEY